MGNLVCCMANESGPKIRLDRPDTLNQTASKFGPNENVIQSVMHKEAHEENETKASVESIPYSNLRSKSELESIKIRRSNLLSNKRGKLTDFYILKEHLGTGAFGSVYRAIDKKTHEIRAVKTLVLPDEQSKARKMLEEVEILKTLDHPNIIPIYEVILEEDKLHIVTELCTGGELFDRILDSGRFSENQAAKMMFDIMKAVMYCHKFGIVHRDLKAENLLFETKNPDALIKVIDFGTSKKINPNTKMKTLMGTVSVI